MAAQSHYSCEAGCSSCKKHFGLERDSPPDPRSECRQSIRLQQKHGSGIRPRISDYDSFCLSVSLGRANAPGELSILLRDRNGNRQRDFTTFLPSTNCGMLSGTLRIGSRLTAYPKLTHGGEGGSDTSGLSG